MKAGVMISFMLFCLYAEAQIFTPDTNAYKSFIQVDLNIEYENGVFDNEFIDLLFSDSFIPREIRTENLNRQTLQNPFGLNFIQNNEAYLGMVKPIKKRERFGLKVGFDWRFSLYGKHSDDFMTLAFLGNQPFINESANAGPTEINLFNHQRLKFGIYDKRKHSFLNIALGKGTRLIQYSFDRSAISTSADGSSIDFNWNGSYRNVDQNNWTDFNGKSISLDGRYYFIHRPSEKRKFLNILYAELSHFGIMHWNKTSETQLDTSFTFDGFEIGNFLDDSFTFPDQNAIEDSININSEQKSHTQFLPYRILFNASSLRESGISYGFEVDYWARMNMIPNIRFQLGYLARRNLKFNSEFTLGGYQNFKAGFWLEWELNYSWYWKIGTHHFIDNFSNNGLGRSIFINLKRDIR
ncbi:MAG: hypothetical protein AAF487_10520 [Bacteroidota bacterium]